MMEGQGKVTKSETGKFMHTGGWLFVHDNNSIEVNMLECAELEKFNFGGYQYSREESSARPGPNNQQHRLQTKWLNNPRYDFLCSV